MKTSDVHAAHEAARKAREEARRAAREAQKRATEDTHGRELLRFAGSAHGRAAFEAEEARVLARRRAYDLAWKVGAAPHMHQPWVWVLPVASGGGAAVPDHPFKGKNASAVISGTPTPKVRVVFGIVNSTIPTINDYATGMDVPLDGTTDTPPRPPELEITADYGIVYVETVWGGMAEPLALVSAEVIYVSGVMPPSDDDTHGYQALFSVTRASGGASIESIAQGVTSSLWVQRVKCNAGASYFFTGVTS